MTLLNLLVPSTTLGGPQGRPALSLLHMTQGTKYLQAKCPLFQTCEGISLSFYRATLCQVYKTNVLSTRVQNTQRGKDETRDGILEQVNEDSHHRVSRQ